MDLISLVPIAASLLIISFSIYYIPCLFRTLKTTIGTKRLALQTPPGRTGLPFIGETLELLFNGKKGVPERFVLDRIKKYSSKVFKTSLLGQQVIVLGSPEGHKFLFSNENKLVKTWWPRHVHKLFPAPSRDENTLDEKSLSIHNSILSFFKPDALQRYVPIIDSTTKQHLHRHLDGRDVVPFLQLAKELIFGLALRLFLGIEDEQIVARLEKTFDPLAVAIFSLPLSIPGTRFYRGLKAKETLVKEIDVLIRQWKSDFSEGRVPESGMALAGVLQQAFDAEDSMIMADSILASLLGAYDTTSSTLSAIMMYMAKLPHVYENVLAEQQEIAKSKAPQEMLNWEDLKKMKYSWNVAREVLRLHPPLAGTYREAISNCTFEEFFIPKGWKLHWDPYSTHMNSEYFKNPNNFDPSRFEGDGPKQFSYVPFGGGPRMCPGKEYARIQILIVIHNVVTKFKWEMVFPDEKMINDPLLRPSKGLPIRLHPHM